MSLWIAAGLAACMFAIFWKSRLQFSRLSHLAPGGALLPDSVLIVIPARDEAKNIGRCLDSLVGQGAAIRVVDDGSSDATSAISIQKGAEVIAAPPLLAGCFGKPSACYAGSKDVTARWLLFVDADTWYEPGFVQAVVAHAEDAKLDVISVMLDHQCRNLWESALVPYSFGVLFAGVDLESVHSIKLQQLLAFGHCILFRTEAYEFTGGHRTVLRSVVDELGVAQVVKRHRLRYEITRGEKFGHVRPGPSFLSQWRGYLRTIFTFLRLNPATLVLQYCFAVLVTLCWAPMLWWLWREGETIATWTFAVVPMLATLVWYRSPLRAILAPIAIYVFAGAVLSSLLAHLFDISGVWKGRRI